MAAELTREGGKHPHWEAQVQHLNGQVVAFQTRAQPVISVDAKKKERVGDFKNEGREWQPSGAPEAVRVPDSVKPELGKAIPHGVFDLSALVG